MHQVELKMTFYMNKVSNRVKTIMKKTLKAVTKIFWVSVMNKLYYISQFWYVTLLFSSNKLLKLKYIHYSFFPKISNENNTARLMGLFVLQDVARYGPGSTVHPSIWLKICCTNIKHLVISILFSVLIFLLHVHGLSCFVLEMGSKIFQS